MDLNQVIQKIDEAMEDGSIPKRVRIVLQGVGEELKKDNQDLAVKVTTAIYELDDLTGDINIPAHAKTILWDIVSDLEAIKKE